MKEYNHDDLIRAYAHSVRNHLNATEMEVSLLEESARDEDSKQSLERLRKEMTGLRTTLASLTRRFDAPEKQPAAAIDIFSQWQSLVNNSAPESAVRWSCEVGSAIIKVDMKMVAGILAEITLACRAGNPEARAFTDDHRARFEIRPEAGNHLPALLPGAEKVISENGGQLEADTTGYTAGFPLFET